MFHIFHNVTIKFSFIDRLRILLGRNTNIEVKMLTNDENIQVLSTKTDVFVDTVFGKEYNESAGYIDSVSLGSQSSDSIHYQIGCDPPMESPTQVFVISKELLDEAIEHLKTAQGDRFYEDTQEVIFKLSEINAR